MNILMFAILPATCVLLALCRIEYKRTQTDRSAVARGLSVGCNGSNKMQEVPARMSPVSAGTQGDTITI
jgi:hypothetical protein